MQSSSRAERRMGVLNPEWVPVILLMGQTSLMTLNAGLVIITGRALFLSTYGAAALPYVYIAVGIVVSAVFYGLAQLFRRWSLMAASMTLVLGMAILLLAARIGLMQPGFEWVSFVLMAIFPLALQATFVIVGAQAGRIFDIQQIKQRLPVIFSGVSVGFLSSGLLINPLLTLLPSTEDMLYGCVIALTLALALLLITNRMYHTQLSAGGAESHSSGEPPRSLPALLRHPFILLIFLYQMLSALGTQLSEYVFLTQSEVNFPTAESMARFQGDFTIGLDVALMIFMFLFAGRLMRRFGMRYGLTANPAIVSILMLIAGVVSITAGPFVTAMLWIATVTHAIDIMFTDGATVTSVNSTYQALPAADRSAIQASIEGIGVPVAYGITGVLLILLNSIPGISLTHIILFTMVVCVIWSIAAILVYQQYKKELVSTLKHRDYNVETLNIEDSTSLHVVEGFLQSGDPVRVQLGLDVLEQANHATLNATLIDLAEHSNDSIRIEALDRIARLRIKEALPQVRNALQKSKNSMARASAITATCALEEADCVEAITPLMDDVNMTIQSAAITGLLRYGGLVGILAAAERLKALEFSDNPADRASAANILGQVGNSNFYKPLIGLMQDESLAVRKEALTAAGKVRNPRLIPQLIHALAEAKVRDVALDSLTQFGDHLLTIFEEALRGESNLPGGILRHLLGAYNSANAAEMINILKQHLDHSDREARTQIMRILTVLGYQASIEEAKFVDEVLSIEAEHGLKSLWMLTQLSAEDAATQPLYSALTDEMRSARERLFLLLAMLYDPGAVEQTRILSLQADSKERALAQEIIEVTLIRSHQRILLPLIMEDFSFLDQPPFEAFELPAILDEVLSNPDYSTWTHACALYAGGASGLKKLATYLPNALKSTDAALRETAVWVLHRLKPAQFEKLTRPLRNDPDPRVTKIIAALSAHP